MNQVRLVTVLSEREALRYTPAGITVLDVVLTHRSEVVEAGHPRQLDFEFEARAVGEVAEALALVDLGASLEVVGFLSTTRKNSRRLILHIQAIKQQTKQAVIV